MKGWEINANDYFLSGTNGKCPNCKSDQVEASLTERGKRISLTFICKSCGSSDHFDGFKE